MRTILRKPALYALLAAAVWTVSSLAAAAENLTPDAVQRLRAASVMVYVEFSGPYENYMSWGTGFVVGDGLVMTNAHVVRGETPVRIFLTNEYLPPTEARVAASRYDAGVSGSPGAAGSLILSEQNSNYDIALLAFTPPPGVRLPALTFSRGAVPHQSVYAVGYPFSRLEQRSGRNFSAPDAARTGPPVFTPGRINKVIGGSPLLVMHDAYCDTGSSGGPLVNARGEIVGMQTWTAVDGPRGQAVTSFAIASGNLASFLSGIRQRTPAQPPQVRAQPYSAGRG